VDKGAFTESTSTSDLGHRELKGASSDDSERAKQHLRRA
jgi:hypothetical protein